LRFPQQGAKVAGVLGEQLRAGAVDFVDDGVVRHGRTSVSSNGVQMIGGSKSASGTPASHLSLPLICEICVIFVLHAFLLLEWRRQVGTKINADFAD
jgi:hypothetical protein